jgi:cephalosporin hydroxylase
VQDTQLGTKISLRFGEDNPASAVKWFMERTKDFTIEHLENHFLISLSPNGWLRRR